MLERQADVSFGTPGSTDSEVLRVVDIVSSLSFVRSMGDGEWINNVERVAIRVFFAVPLPVFDQLVFIE